MTRRLRWTLRLFTAIASAYVGAVSCDSALQVCRAAAVAEMRRRSAVPGLAQLDPVLGYRLARDFTARLDAPGGAAVVRTNSLGHRDDEPPAKLDTLLVGDSFCYGALLDQEETISARARARTGRTHYNAGVGGYHAGQVLEALRRCFAAGLRPRRVVYLFYHDDLLDPAALDVSGFRIEGGLLARGRRRGAPGVDWGAAAELRLVRSALTGAVYDTPPLASAAALHGTVKLTRRMQALARDHAAAFEVLVVPTVAEAAEQRYREDTRAFIGSIAGLQVPTRHALAALGRDDYWPADIHVTAEGARRLSEALDGPAETSHSPLPRPDAGR